MPVIVVLTGAVIIMIIESTSPVRSLHETILEVIVMATFTGGALALTTGLYWGWWKNP
jgi:hypothetical protein